MIAAFPASWVQKITVEGECWVWNGARNRKGYGSVSNGKNGSSLAHRKAYELAIGPIPEGLTIDHLCENKACVRPAHLEPVTRSENSARYYRKRRPAVVSGPGFTDIVYDFFPHLAK